MGVLEFIFGVIIVVFLFMTSIIYFAFKYDRLDYRNDKQKDQEKRVKKQIKEDK